MMLCIDLGVAALKGIQAPLRGTISGTTHCLPETAPIFSEFVVRQNGPFATNTPSVHHRIQCLRVLENILLQKGMQSLAALLPRLQNVLRMEAIMDAHLKQVEGNVVVHRHQSVAVQLGEIRNREHDSIEPRLVFVHVYASATGEGQTIYNGDVHVAHLDRHLELDDRNTRVDHRQQGGIQAAGQLASVRADDGAVNRDLGLRIDGGDDDVLEAPGYGESVLHARLVAVRNRLSLDRGERRRGHRGRDQGLVPLRSGLFGRESRTVPSG